VKVCTGATEKKKEVNRRENDGEFLSLNIILFYHQTTTESLLILIL
jgi:hypothetical protein